MPLIPSEKLSATLEHSRAGLWVEELVDGRIVLATKAPTNVIKAVYLGATCSLLISVVEAEQAQILCLGFRVQDEAENPYSWIEPFVAPKNQQVLERLLTSTSTTMYFFNELSHYLNQKGCRSCRVFWAGPLAVEFHLSIGRFKKL